MIEGLRELTHLRVLNLSYNRISRIGQGIASSNVVTEGLNIMHRLILTYFLQNQLVEYVELEMFIY